MTFPSNSIFFIEQRRKSSKLLVDWKNQQLSPSQTRKMHNVIHESLENFFKIANFSGFLTFLKILHFSARILPILEFYLPKLDSPFSACFIEMARVEAGDLKFDAATEHNGCKWTENLNFQQCTTTATVHLTQTLPTGCWQSPPKKALFQRKRNFR